MWNIWTGRNIGKKAARVCAECQLEGSESHNNGREIEIDYRDSRNSGRKIEIYYRDSRNNGRKIEIDYRESRTNGMEIWRLREIIGRVVTRVW